MGEVKEPHTKANSTFCFLTCDSFVYVASNPTLKVGEEEGHALVAADVAAWIQALLANDDESNKHWKALEERVSETAVFLQVTEFIYFEPEHDNLIHVSLRPHDTARFCGLGIANRRRVYP